MFPQPEPADPRRGDAQSFRGRFAPCDVLLGAFERQDNVNGFNRHG
jgi:hypothetical protein